MVHVVAVKIEYRRSSRTAFPTPVVSGVSGFVSRLVSTEVQYDAA